MSEHSDCYGEMSRQRKELEQKDAQIARLNSQVSQLKDELLKEEVISRVRFREIKELVTCLMVYHDPMVHGNSASNVDCRTCSLVAKHGEKKDER